MGKCKNYSTVYGASFSIPSIIELQAFMARADCKHHVDVLIQIGDEKKEFTFKDFTKRLGFEDKE